ncbi:MAG: iron complex outermembrane receptor protein [Planctomycetota bacterium]|jgi:iron complex outermembrane receptor protein
MFLINRFLSNTLASNRPHPWGPSRLLIGVALLVATAAGTPANAASIQSGDASPSSSDDLLPGMSPTSTEAEEDDWEDEDFADLDLSELLEVDCTVVSRQSESLQGAPAAVYVINGEEIRRAGHASVQEALRMVPGFFVSHWASSDWDATIRGFGPGIANANLAYLNQVLVMVDGVVVYTPLFAGMWWGLQDMDMDHIERIEVIRGPSGILWGANAFHGLVNIITKTSGEKTESRLSVRYSNDNSFVTLRGDVDLSDTLGVSAFARRTRYDTQAFQDDSLNGDLSDVGDWGIQSGGFQVDGTGENGRTWRASARGYESKVAQPYDIFGTGTLEAFPHRKHGGQASLQWNDPESGTFLQAAYVKDRQTLTLIGTSLDIDQIQLEARRTVATGENSSLMFGLGYDRIFSNTNLYGGFAVNAILQNNVRAFASETWRIPSANLAFSLGLQAIDHEFSGLDLQPSARVAWSPKGRGTLWASASRAIRTPSIEEEVLGLGTLDAESVVAVEGGWRGQLNESLGIDLAVYYNDYNNVRVHSFDPFTFDESFTNDGKGHSMGAELAVDVKANDRWTLRGAYSLHRSQHNAEADDIDVTAVDGQYPVHMLNVRSYFDLADEWELDSALYLVDRFDALDGAPTPEYWRGDLRVGWRPSDSLRLSVGVQGFNDPTRSEFGTSEVRRLFYLSLDLIR